MTGPVRTPPEAAGLKARLSARFALVARNEAGMMIFLFTAASVVLRLGSNMTLTRLLDPTAFGIIGVIMSVVVVLTMLTDLGYHSFVVRHARGDDPRFLDVIWSIRLVQAIGLMIVMILIAGPVAGLLNKPQIAMPMMATAPIFVLNALPSMAVVLAERRGQVRVVSMIEFGSLTIQIITNIAIAIVIQNYWSLLIGLYVGAIARIVISRALLEGRSKLSFDRATIAEFLNFSKIVAASSAITLLLEQSDKFLFARLFTLEQFGVYMVAVSLALAAMEFGRNYCGKVFFPLIARVYRETNGNREAILATSYQSRRRIYPLLFAAFGAAIGMAPVIIAILFDHRYQGASVFLALLLARVVMELDTYANAQILFASGRTQTMLLANLVRLSIFVIAVSLLFSTLGPVAIPAAMACAELVVMSYFVILLRTMGFVSLRRQAGYYALAIACCGLGAVISHLLLGLAERLHLMGAGAL